MLPLFTPLVLARNELIYFLAGFQKISTVMYLSLNLNYFYFMFSPILQHLNYRYKRCLDIILNYRRPTLQEWALLRHKSSRHPYGFID